MRIGRGKSFRCVGDYFREHRKLAVAGSETKNDQVTKFEEFLTKSE